MSPDCSPPRLATNNVVSRVPGDHEVTSEAGDAATRLVKHVDGHGIGFAQLRKGMGSAITDSILGRTIVHVVAVCTDSEVSRSYALRVIARVKYLKALGNLAIGQDPSMPVRVYEPAFVAEIPVAVRQAGTSPKPARRCLFHTAPEKIECRWNRGEGTLPTLSVIVHSAPFTLTPLAVAIWVCTKFVLPHDTGHHRKASRSWRCLYAYGDAPQVGNYQSSWGTGVIVGAVLNTHTANGGVTLLRDDGQHLNVYALPA